MGLADDRLSIDSHNTVLTRLEAKIEALLEPDRLASRIC
jgi:hypothetical protein